MDSVFGQFMSETFGQFDMACFALNGAIQNDFFTLIAKFVSSCGNTLFWFLLCGFGFVLCLFKRTRKVGFILLFCVAFLALLTKFLINPFFGRLRPYNALQSNSEYFQWYLNVGAIAESEFSFPSKHVAVIFAVAVGLFCYIKKDLKKNTGWVLFLIAIVVAWSRNYLMVHYATDIIAGAILGIIIGLITFKICDLLPNFDNVDLEKFFIKKTGHTISNKKALALICFVIPLLIVLVSFAYDIYKENDASYRCEYQDEYYKCYNKADDKQVYNADKNRLEFRCKLHDK